MKKVSKLLFLTALLLVAALVVSGINYTPNAYATKEIWKEAKDKYGSEVKGCKHCHVKALPKEDDHEMNDVGKFLVAKKKEKGAETIDVAWLADYKPSN